MRTTSKRKRISLRTALLIALVHSPVWAATIKVGPGCKLFQGIIAANTDKPVGACTRGRGPDTIVLPKSSVHNPSAVNNSIFGPTGLPAIRTVITIQGNGSTIGRLPTAPAFRIFSVAPTGSLTLLGTTVTGGKGADGAGIKVNSVPGIGRKLTLIDSTVSGNIGAGITLWAGRDYYDYPSVTLNNSIISGNAGWGIDLGGSTAKILDSTISENRSGGIAVDLSGLTINSSTVSGNGRGTGIWVYAGGATIRNSTITGNSGGGIFVGNGSASVVNSTISGNSSAIGGGISVDNNPRSYYDGAGITVTNTTITGNHASIGGGIAVSGASDLRLARTLVSGNTARAAREVFLGDEATVYASNFNLFGHSARAGTVGFTPGSTDLVPSQPVGQILDTFLLANGGLTETHALVAGSAAIDAVFDGTCPLPIRDQRGVKRPRDGNDDGGPACDIGAFER